MYIARHQKKPEACSHQHACSASQRREITKRQMTTLLHPPRQCNLGKCVQTQKQNKISASYTMRKVVQDKIKNKTAVLLLKLF